MTRLPLVLIAGYLGAGKTTLVNHLLRHAQGRRIAVLVNDFGSINIDAELIAAGADEAASGTSAGASSAVLSLAGGCLCCSFGDDLVGTLCGLQQRQPPPDVCLVELSGVALPAGVARTARLAPAVDVVGTLVVADVQHIQRQAADRYVGDTVLQQLQQADWVMLNKPDLVTPAALQATASWLQTVAPQARHWAGDAQTVGPELLLGWPARADAPGSEPQRPPAWAPRPIGPAQTGPQPAQALFDSRSRVLPPGTDLQVLGAQLAAPSSGVLRAKAVLNAQVLQVAGGRWAVTALAAPPSSDTRGPSLGSSPGVSGHLVMIGLRGQWQPDALWP